MERGFKARAEKISARYRKVLGISQNVAMPVDRLADHLGIKIWEPADVSGLTKKDLDQLCGPGSDEWSAVTVSAGTKSLIIVNPTHSKARRANDISHELAHIILDHRKARVEISADGHMWIKTYPKDLEEEADWLSATLLLPRDGLLRVCSEKQDKKQVARVFGVSVVLVTMRINQTGIMRQLKRKIA